MPLVNVLIVTYNQEKYISQAIESVLTQKTNFSFTIILSDDCSVDSTSEICREYAKKYHSKIVYNRNIENLGLVRNYKIAFDLCDAKYIAILEGDDYWIDEYKLQKQVDILESDNDIGLVHTNCNRLYEDESINIKNNKKPSFPKSGNVFEELLKRNFITSITTCFRRKLIQNTIQFDLFYTEGFLTIDYPIWLEISKVSDIFYLNQVTANYRILKNSISNNSIFEKRIEYQNNIKNIKINFIEKYEPNRSVAKKLEKEFLMINFKTSLIYCEKKSAIEYLSKLIEMNKLYLIIYPLIQNKNIFKIICRFVNFCA